MWAAGCGGGAGAPGLELPPAAAARNPVDLILISVDTLRPDRLSCYGHRRETSPNLDRMAAEGVLFERAFSHSPKTAAAHMSLMTGLYPEAHRVGNAEQGGMRRLGAAIPTLALLLRRAGYRTRAITGGANVQGELGFDRGFESYQGRKLDAAEAFTLAGDALEELAAGGAERAPFFLFLHTYEVHDPYLPPASWRAPFVDPQYGGAIRSGREELLAANWTARSREFWGSVERDDAADLRHLQDLYAASIRYTDDQLGRLLERIQQLGLSRRALIVFLSDHGEEFREHGGFLHNSVYQEVLRVPLVLRFPDDGSRDDRGRRVREVVGLVDVLPSVLEYLGLAAPAHLQGRSFMPLLEGARLAPVGVLSQWRKKGWYSYREGPWKLLVAPGRELLFHLERDPGELRNLAREEPERVRALERAAEALLEESRRLAALAGAGPAVSLDADTRDDLDALGYVGTGDE